MVHHARMPPDAASTGQPTGQQTGALQLAAWAHLPTGSCHSRWERSCCRCHHRRWWIVQAQVLGTGCRFPRSLHCTRQHRGSLSRRCNRMLVSSRGGLAWPIETSTISPALARCCVAQSPYLCLLAQDWCRPRHQPQGWVLGMGMPRCRPRHQPQGWVMGMGMPRCRPRHQPQGWVMGMGMPRCRPLQCCRRRRLGAPPTRLRRRLGRRQACLHLHHPQQSPGSAAVTRCRCRRCCHLPAEPQLGEERPLLAPQVMARERGSPRLGGGMGCSL